METRYAVIKGILNFATTETEFYGPWNYKTCPFAPLRDIAGTDFSGQRSCGVHCALFEVEWRGIKDGSSIEGIHYTPHTHEVAFLYCALWKREIELTDTTKKG